MIRPQPKPTKRPPKARKPLRPSKPMARGKGLRRSCMKRSARGTAYGRRQRAFGFMAWVKSQRCILAAWALRERRMEPCECSSVVEAHHAGQKGMGMKSPDDTCIPLCRRHHAQWETHVGFFAGWTLEARRAWSALRIVETQNSWWSLHPTQRADWDATAAARSGA